jgi:4-hydroxybenzoyl-CoA thioesterase
MHTIASPDRGESQGAAVNFSVEYLIRFQHCDPAGIVFYPRYYEMLNQVVEDWFAEGLHWSFADMARERSEGIPLVHARCDFLEASQIGERLTFTLELARIGTKSFNVTITATCAGTTRLRAELVLAYVRTTDRMRAIPLPDELRARMQPYLQK